MSLVKLTLLVVLGLFELMLTVFVLESLRVVVVLHSDGQSIISRVLIEPMNLMVNYYFGH